MVNRFYGTVGYATNVETVPGVWRPKIVERNYYGNILSSGRRWDRADDSLQQNDNLRITNKFSILADPFAYQHYNEIRYIVYGGVKWKVRDITIEGRRLIMSLGEEYNGSES